MYGNGCAGSTLSGVSTGKIRSMKTSEIHDRCSSSDESGEQWICTQRVAVEHARAEHDAGGVEAIAVDGHAHRTAT